MRRTKPYGKPKAISTLEQVIWAAVIIAGLAGLFLLAQG